MAKFVLVHVIGVIYHTIPFIWVIILTHVNRYLKNLIVMKDNHCQRFMPNLCYIIYIDLYIGAFSSQTTFNDPYLIQFELYLTKMMGEWQTHLLSNIISFFKDIPNGRMGWS